METIGERIKKYRKKMNLTQQQLADKLNKSKSTIQKYEANAVNLNTDVMNSICSILNIDLFVLLYGEKIKSDLNFEECEDLENKMDVYLEFSDNYILKELINKLTSTLTIEKKLIEEYYYSLIEAFNWDLIYNPNDKLIYITKLNKNITISIGVSQFICFFADIITSEEILFKFSCETTLTVEKIRNNIINKNYNK